MIFTVGNKENYHEAIKRARELPGDESYVQKVGRTENYQGGIVFQTYAAAQRFLEEESHPCWCIWGVEADWWNDTVPTVTKGGWWHDLLVDSRIIPLDDAGGVLDDSD